MLIKKSDIQTYIPQRTPFVMIDSLISANDTSFLGRFKIEKGHIMLKSDGFLEEEALIESIAQTCAAGFNYLSKNSLQENKNNLGYIGAVNDLQYFKKAKVEDELYTEIYLLNKFGPIQLISGVLRIDGELVMKCKMKIVTP